MHLNKKELRPKKLTHEGATAFQHATPVEQLRRTIMSCLLWEDSFYESGQSIAQRITELVAQVPAEQVAALAIEARERMNLRHVPLLLACELAKLKTHRYVVADLVERIIQRADELTEILAIYQRERTGTKRLNKLSHQLQKGLQRAFRKFTEYQLSKHNRDGAIKLRDVLFLIHAKPSSEAQANLWKRLIDGKLATPDTWEVELSAGKGQSKQQSWERLLKEQKLGGLALIRNLRNMREAGVSDKLIRSALLEMKTDRILPFRFVAAARFAPQFEPELEKAMMRCLQGVERLPGKTCIVVDNSGSMYGTKISAKSDMDRSDAACALAILVREVCEEVQIISYSTTPALVPPRRGFALRDAIQSATIHNSTHTDDALALAQHETYDRIIVITDEQSHQAIRNPSYNGLAKKGYFINVASYQNGIGYGPWTHLDGFSERILDYIQHFESLSK
jgi:60 kDa SS-A/Ro ribonucleoprotein